MMGTHRKAEQGVIQSSIALLQERFKQLQRVKEMREKRELVRIFSSDHFSNNINTPSSVTLTTTTTTTTNNSSPTITDSHSTMLFAPPNNYYHDYSSPHHQHKKFYDDDDNDDDYDNNNNNNDKLQIFLPPNYYNYCTTHNNQSSPSSSTSSSSSFQDYNNLSRQNQNQDEVSLSLWPPVSSAINQFRSAREITGAYKSEVYSHVQDVDTTLHL